MPVRKVITGFKNCWQWGHSGKIYCGRGAKQKAYAQERAAYANGYRTPRLKKAAEDKKPDTVKIRPSKKGEQSKYTAIFYENEKKIKTTHFGWNGMSDYTKHKDPERKERYLARHKTNENWNNPMSAGALSRWILWNKPTLKDSKKDFSNKFNIDLAAESRRPEINECAICKTEGDVFYCRHCGLDACAAHYRKDFQSCLPCFNYMKNFLADEKKEIRFMDPHRRLKRLINDVDIDPLEAAKKISFSSDSEDLNR